MPRRRYKKSQKSSPPPASPKFTDKTSVIAKDMPYGIDKSGADFVMEDLYDLMGNSAALADEPEFSDLMMNEHRAVTVTERWLKKHEKRLEAAEKTGPEAYDEVFEDTRIAIVSEMITSAFRNDVHTRLQALIDRLDTSDAHDQLDQAILLKGLLSTKKFPWGLCGLIIAIYDRTMEKTMRSINEEMDLFTSMVNALKAEGKSDQEIDQIIQHPELYEQIGEELFEKNPEMMQRAEDHFARLVDEFEDELVNGNVELDLFDADEISLPFKRIEEKFGGLPDEVEPSEEMGQQITKIFEETAQYILTRERYQRLRDDVEKISREWMRKHHRWDVALQMELGHLDVDDFAESTFVLSVFYGQIKRLMNGEKMKPKKKKRR